MSLLSFLEWLASTRWSIALHESLYMYPLVESTHVLALALFVGLAMMLDLRLLGLALRHVPVSEVHRRGCCRGPRSASWSWWSPACCSSTPFPVRNYQNIFFRVKMVMLLLAGLNVWLFHSRIERAWPTGICDPVPPEPARVAAVVSLVLWAGDRRRRAA